jgi:hypothetical protein
MGVTPSAVASSSVEEATGDLNVKELEMLWVVRARAGLSCRMLGRMMEHGWVGNSSDGQEI